MQRYNPKDIEPKWQAKWEADKIYQVADDSHTAQTKPKKYILEYFPYPSGAAMHVGHVRNYTIGDVVARHGRMAGYNVLHPMGWDSFGLPAENYAIKTGISPRQAIDVNTAKFKQQLIQMGFSYDWSRVIDSSDPNYYRWTQWFFLLLFRKRLAYQKESLQWWCPHDKTVLANEQVEAGLCWRCGNQVEKKLLKQWFFRITDYADRLAADLDNVDWSDSIKTMQRNWIGRSSGALVSFKLAEHSSVVKVFTTRPDTLYGATFMVLSPEHDLVDQITTAEQTDAVARYRQAAQAKSDIERQETNRDKTGVFTGAYAINPINDEKIPVWIADYVLVGYGTGAIMAVPAHDDRDHEFALKFNLPIVSVVEPTSGIKQGDEVEKEAIVAILRNPATGKVLMLDWGPRRERYGGNLFIGGGVDEAEDFVDCARREIAEETGYTNIKHIATAPYDVHSYYYSNVKDKNYYARIRGLLFDLVDEVQLEQKLDDGEQGKFILQWVDQTAAKSLVSDDGHRYIFQALLDAASFKGEGVMVNSGQYDGLSSSQAREKIITDIAAKGVGQEITNYKMRDWLISRQRYWGAPIPIIHCPIDGAVAVPENQLPVLLPEIQSFQPTTDAAGNGRSPLANVPEFVHTTCPTCGGRAERETDTMDGFACSSWYFLRFADPHNTNQPFDSDKVKYWLPVDDYIGGAEHAVMHLLYARFWTKVMHDEGLIDFDEPFSTLRNHGMILAPDGSKMSKSKGNTIEPSVLIDQGYGADAVRIMELFIGPWNQPVAWSVEGMGGAYRFLQRVWILVQECNDADHDATAETSDLNRALHKTIKKVSSDIVTMNFNTAVASLMELVNELYRIKASDQYAASEWVPTLKSLVQLLAPLAPHITEELWQQLGGAGSVHTSDWPHYDAKYLIEDTVIIVVQVNGKVRAELTLAADVDQESALKAAMDDLKIQKNIAGKNIKKTIYVPGKLINLVV